MRYNAKVRRKRGANVTMNNVEAIDIYTVARKIRGKHDLYGEDPHKGFIINQSLTSKVKN